MHVCGGEFTFGVLVELMLIGSVWLTDSVVEKGGGVVRYFDIDIWYPPAVETSARIVFFGQSLGPSKIRKTQFLFFQSLEISIILMNPFIQANKQHNSKLKISKIITK
jgi:hypothetical protein